MFIVIDGADGTGKTTMSKNLVDNFLANSVYTSEPTVPMPKDESLLDFFIEDRKRHQEDIKSWINQDKDVVCDRYKYSTIVYQHIFEGHSIEKLIKLNEEFLIPNITFIITSNIDTIMDRIKSRGKNLDIFETRDIQIKVLELFRKMPKFFPKEKIVLLE
jgi:thymidylate kinase